MGPGDVGDVGPSKLPWPFSAAADLDGVSDGHRRAFSSCADAFRAPAAMAALEPMEAFYSYEVSPVISQIVFQLKS